MEGRIVLRGRQRSRLTELYRSNPDPALRLRAHIILLLADGHSWAVIATVLFCSTATIARWKDRFEEGGVEALAGQARGRSPRLSLAWAATAVGWVQHRWPADFGLVRSRWCCATVVVLMMELHHVRVGVESVRRWLHQRGMVWRRPRPVLGRKDPLYRAKVNQIRLVLASVPAHEAVVFTDEVDINTNPKIGSMWMPRGQQAQVVTPGDNTKRYLAGSLNWRTGTLIATPGSRRNGELFVAHLEDLRRHFRCYTKIHVLCDNARFHKRGAVVAYLQEWGHRFELHYLPLYAPETNPIERVWWKLHEQITRNHRCKSITELLDLVFAWLEQRQPFEVEDQAYFAKAA
jgi:putative transposase